MIDIVATKQEIIDRLSPEHPDKVILFGSWAYGEPTDDSDLDLYVVTADAFVPGNWKEKNEVYLRVARLLEPVMKRCSTDLVVHTRNMHETFVALGSSFSRKIMREGLVLHG